MTTYNKSGKTTPSAASMTSSASGARGIESLQTHGWRGPVRQATTNKRIFSMTVHAMDFNRIEVYEAGAMLLTLLAYPRSRLVEPERILRTIS
jgi:hypothetical protein